MSRVLAALLTLALLVAGCGEDDPSDESSDSTTTEQVAPPADLASTDLADVEVSGDPGELPTITFEQPFGLEETANRTITEGDGDTVANGVNVTFDFVFLNGRDGSTIESSFDQEPASLVLDDNLLPGIRDGLDGSQVGERILVGISPADGLGADPEAGIEASDTLLFYAEVLSVRTPLARAEGTAVAPVEGLPTVTLDDSGAPTITVPDGTAPTELIAQPLIEGTGPVVEAGQTITAHYTGVVWDSGEVFDSSWERGAPSSFAIGTGAVIAGWDEGLVGRTVGSQILLVIPPDKAYPDGSPDGSITGEDTLVFVIDILDAS